MKRIFDSIEKLLTRAALLEEGAGGVVRAAHPGGVRESIEENLIEVAFAEAADYDDIHRAILREHRDERDHAHPDDCGQGDNELCFV